jgi:hypothetical protein
MPKTRKRKPSKAHRIRLKKRYEEFCQALFDSDGDATKAAILVGYSGWWGRYLARLPRIRQRLQEISQQFAKQREKDRLGNARLTEAFLDEQLMFVAANGGRREQAKAIELGLRKLKLIEPNGPRAIAAAAAGTIVGGTFGGPTMAEIYKSKWLREKERALAADAEAEFKQRKPSK